jgi:integrase
VKNLGRIHSEKLPSGAARYRIIFHTKGKRIKVSRLVHDNGVEVPFGSREAAKFVLDGIRSLVAQGMTLERAIAQYRPMDCPEDLVENRLTEHLDYFREMVEAGKRSPTSLKELARYAKDGGHFSFWFGQSARDISFGAVEDWHRWLAGRGIALKTQKNVSDAFRAFLRRLKRRGEIDSAPEFPAIEVPDYAPRIIDAETQARILDAIPWERRGAFLAAATEALRVGEIRALNLDDYQDGRLKISKAIQGHGTNARTRHTKNRSAEWRQPWNEDLVAWIEWRLENATPAAKLRGEVALLWNPTAKNLAKRWTHETLHDEWKRACKAVGEDVPFQEGTRHSILTTLGEVLPERMLQAFSRHRSSKSLGHYSKPRATRAAIRKATSGCDK